MADNSTKANLIAKILFITGGIILFIVLVIFIFRMVPIAISNIANVGSSITSGIRNIGPNSDEDIIVTTEADSVEVKTPVIVSFAYTPTEAGSFFISYPCEDGLFYDIQSSNGAKRIICNTPFKLGGKVSSISLIPIFTKTNAFVDSTLKIEYKDEENNTLAFGTKTLTITSGEDTTDTSTDENPYDANGNLSGSTVTTTPIKTPVTNTVVTPKPTPTYTYTNPTRDLVVTHITGSSNSTFVMHVYNYGNSSTGGWQFTYTDAENPSQVRTSPTQASLGAGQGLAVTVRFDGQDNSSQKVNVYVDSSNWIAETNESNNSASTVIYGNTSGSDDDYDYDSNDDADLVIKSMEVGRMSGNRFSEDDEVEEDDTAAVRFTVKNEGGESTGSWKFEITNLPYDDSNDTYRSKSYSSLKPGESIEIVVEFEGIDEGRYSIRTEVDSEDDVDEERENNNTRSESLDVNN